MVAQPRHQKMPPLTALRAFEAAGRLGGFTPAAQELGVTPGAVTAHLKNLESLLGVTLFERLPRGVALTPLGAQVLPEFTAAFRALDAAVHRLEQEAAPGLVRIATTPDIAALWLSPRLPGLRAQGVQVVPMPVAGPEAAGVADLSLFFEPGDGHCVAVAAPEWIAAQGDGLPPEACMTLRGPLGSWDPWLAQAGLLVAPRGLAYDQAVLALEEAANGAGVVVLPQVLAERAVAQGRVALLRGVRAPMPWALTVRVLRDGSGGATLDSVVDLLGASADVMVIRG